MASLAALPTGYEIECYLLITAFQTRLVHIQGQRDVAILVPSTINVAMNILAGIGFVSVFGVAFVRICKWLTQYHFQCRIW